MSFWDQLLSRLKRFLEFLTPSALLRGEPVPSRTGLERSEGLELQPLHRRVLLITFDPTLQSQAGRQLSRALGWHHVEELVEEFIADLRECSNGLAEFEVVERIAVDAWPVKTDGFRYDENRYLNCLHNRAGWHKQDIMDYEPIIAEFGLLGRIESGQIDEVWMFGFPFAGFYESIMVGPAAFWCNAPPLVHSDGLSRRFIIMGFNYERDVGPMLESFGHRVESLLKHAWRGFPGAGNLWEQFVLYDKIAPGRANCGSIHYAPNSRHDYQWDNPVPVPSNCDDWLSFPDFQGLVRPVDCREWGNGDMRAHHKWWLRHLPKAAGYTGDIANNWWRYAADPNAAACLPQWHSPSSLFVCGGS